jgi:hypothetical protein
MDLHDLNEPLKPKTPNPSETSDYIHSDALALGFILVESFRFCG